MATAVTGWAWARNRKLYGWCLLAGEQWGLPLVFPCSVNSTSDLSLDCFSQHTGTRTYTCTHTVVKDSEEAAGGESACEPHVPTTCSAPRVYNASVCRHLAENQIPVLGEIVWRFTPADRLGVTRLKHSPRPKLSNLSSPDFTGSLQPGTQENTPMPTSTSHVWSSCDGLILQRTPASSRLPANALVSQQTHSNVATAWTPHFHH